MAATGTSPETPPFDLRLDPEGLAAVERTEAVRFVRFAGYPSAVREDRERLAPKLVGDAVPAAL
jgi:hypothetical protein